MSEVLSYMYIGLLVKYPLFLSDFNVIWIFSADFKKIFKYQISWKSVQWEPSCSVRRAGRWQTDRHMAKIIIAFHNFPKAPIKIQYVKSRCNCTVHKVLLPCTGFWWGNLKERDHWGNPGADGRIILRWIFSKWDVGMWTGSSWLRIGTGGGHLWMR